MLRYFSCFFLVVKVGHFTWLSASCSLLCFQDREDGGRPEAAGSVGRPSRAAGSVSGRGETSVYVGNVRSSVSLCSVSFVLLFISLSLSPSLSTPVHKTPQTWVFVAVASTSRFPGILLGSS